jgi:uncharacterized repeat protein (TIGR03803 family)
LHSFTLSDGANPEASLVLDGAGNLYGTTYAGGASSHGTVFTVKTNGSGFTVLHSFAWNSADGGNPRASLVLDGSGNLYGTTYEGGASNLGTVFRIKTDGTGFTVLHSFLGGTTDGRAPEAGLVLDGSGNLYGTTYRAGASGYGTVFRIKTDGTGFTVLHNFSWNSADGMDPRVPLVLDTSGSLYGTTYRAGASGYGTVFRIKTDGTGFTVLHGFAGWATDGAYPYGSLILDGSGNLYGTSAYGGARNLGIVFSLPTSGDLPPQELTISKSGTGTGLVTSSPGGIDCGQTCAARFVDSTVVTLSATAESGSTFSEWSGEGCSGTGTCQVTMSQARSVTAIFTVWCSSTR